MLASTGSCKEDKEEPVCSIYSFVQVFTVIGFKVLHLLFELFGDMQLSVINSKLRSLQVLSYDAPCLPA